MVALQLPQGLSIIEKPLIWMSGPSFSENQCLPAQLDNPGSNFTMPFVEDLPEPYDSPRNIPPLSDNTHSF